MPIQGEPFNFARDRDGAALSTRAAIRASAIATRRRCSSTTAGRSPRWSGKASTAAAIETFVQKLIDMPMDKISSSQIHSVLIARHGKLVLEEYFHGHDRDTPHDTRSAAKSWTNVLIGAAMQAGVPIRLDTPVYQTMLGSRAGGPRPAQEGDDARASDQHDRRLRLRRFRRPAGRRRPMQEQTKEPDWYRYSLNVPMAWNAGRKDRLLQHQAEPGRRNAREDRRRAAAGDVPPAGRASRCRMGHYHLFLQPTGQPMAAAGIISRSRDFMKLTQLFLNDGKWEGRQIVSREWARKSSAALRNPVADQRPDLRLSLELGRLRLQGPQAARLFPRRERRPGLHRHSRPRPADRLHRRQLRRSRAVPLPARVRARGYSAGGTLSGFSTSGGCVTPPRFPPQVALFHPKEWSMRASTLALLMISCLALPASAQPPPTASASEQVRIQRRRRLAHANARPTSLATAIAIRPKR